MSKIFIFGASFSYGVGGEEGGWADLLKKKLHSIMYAPGGIGEKHEIYNFGKPGAMSNFVNDTYSFFIDNFSNEENKIAIVSIGLNDSRAKERPDNFVSNIEDFKKTTQELLFNLKQKVNHLICLEYLPVDEVKTTPKPNPLTGGSTYFFNSRIKEFNDVFKEMCKEQDVKLIEFEINEDDWIKNCLYEDGLHPNKVGHNLIFEKLWPEVEKLI
jgi:lysophospholipase L1-like esterase